MTDDRTHRLDARQVRVLANPLRQEILGLLCREALSAARLSERLTAAPTNLHYHLDRLHDAGLVELVEERPVRGAVEKIYRAVASNFSVAPEAFAHLGAEGPDSGLLRVIRQHADWVLTEIGAALADADGEPPLTSHERLRLSPADAGRLRRLLIEWLEDCRRCDGATGPVEQVEEWALLASFFRRSERTS